MQMASPMEIDLVLLTETSSEQMTEILMVMSLDYLSAVQTVRQMVLMTESDLVQLMEMRSGYMKEMQMAMRLEHLLDELTAIQMVLMLEMSWVHLKVLRLVQQTVMPKELSLVCLSVQRLAM